MDKQEKHCFAMYLDFYRLSDEDNILAHNIICECLFEQPA